MEFLLKHIFLLNSHRIPLLILTFFFPLSSIAQLQADFTLDQSAGCSPLAVLFTNTSSGTSANATFHWNFGNGNNSILKDPGAVFHNEETYTVTLTVKDGSHQSTKTKTVTVYKRPVADFTLVPGSGCLPLQTVFNSTSHAGDGTLSGYHWDFGDGSTQSGASSSVTHTYNFLQTATVSLTAINSFGCSNTKVREGIVNVSAAPQVAFNADRLVACDIPAIINFSASVTGTGPNQYLWDFGDNTTSTEPAPSHTYTSRGTYSVKLTIVDAAGCSVVLTKPSYLNIANFVTQFQEPALICNNGNVTFLNNSSPVPVNNSWIFDDVNAVSSWGNSPVTYAFATEGVHTVMLTSNYGPCQQSITRSIMVHKKPALSGFISSLASLCGAPLQATFQDTTQGAVAWAWNFNWPSSDPLVTSTLQNPNFHYSNDGSYQVKLTVTNSEGCNASVTRTIDISKPLVGIFLDDGYSNRGCDQLIVKFKPRSTEAITGYQWSFGDNTHSTDAEPTHTYSQPGTYTVTLNYTTVNGCTGSVTYNSIIVLQKPVANFNVQASVCGNTPVAFNNTSSGNVSQNYWNFGDHSGFVAASPAMHQYQTEGVFDVTLIAANDFCRDTITKSAIIQVLPPFTKIISPATYTCEGTRGKVSFNDASRLSDNWNWAFGDNTSVVYNAFQPTIQHTYQSTGVYKVVLTTSRGSCSVKDSIEVRVLLKQHPRLQPVDPVICAGSSLNVQVTGLERPPFPASSIHYIQPYNYAAFTDESGVAFSGTVNPQPTNIFPWSAVLGNFQRGTYRLRTITQSSFYGCRDTTDFITINVKGPIAVMNVVSDNVCFKDDVVFEDASAPVAGVSIVTCEWNFGDGNWQASAPGVRIAHRYTNPGNYNVTLKVTDVSGCSAITNRQVSVRGPKALFNAMPANVAVNGNVVFNNSTNTINSGTVQFNWTFGDGSISSAYAPSHIYSNAGSFVATLITQGNHCSDTASQTINVSGFSSGFTTTQTYLSSQGQCPPVLARFVSTSSGIIGLNWDFGDGNTLAGQQSASHIYHLPGKYVVKLTVRSINGLSSVFTDTIEVNLPVATFDADNFALCKFDQLTFSSADHESVASYLWDAGDGTVVNTQDSFHLHHYQSPGTYHPVLVVKDGRGCHASVPLVSPVIVYPDPVITIDPVPAIACKGVAVQLQASGALNYSWSPGNGLNVITGNAPVALPDATTVYQVQGTDANNCKGSAQITVIVPGPVSLISDTALKVCQGEQVQMNVTGATRFQWIDNISGLSTINSGNPSVSPAANSIYTVVGYDAYDCYSDTQQIVVDVKPLPVVDAGSDRQVIMGSANQLSVNASQHISRWAWSPGEFLSCTHCASPISRPYKDIEYIVTAYDENNCMGKDTLKIAVICAETELYIPNAFTPDRNGKNDRLVIVGQGIRNIRSFTIFNRWGEMIFRRSNFYPNDAASGWNGLHKGVEAPAGTYVYIIEMECNAGQTFMRKGTITLLR